MSDSRPLILSVVIPMYNEQDAFPLMAARLRPVLDGLGVRYEVVAVDDGSTDRTAPLLHDMRRSWPELRVIGLRRNCGHQAALTAGMHHAGGAYVVSIDADLQDPPEKIAEMLFRAQAEHLDIVYGIRSDRRSDTWAKRATAGLYYRIMRRYLGSRLPHNAGDFRLLSRSTVDVLRQLPEHEPVYRLLVPWIGFPSGEVRYVRERRAAGRTKYPLSKMVRLAADSVTSFSAAPLRMATWLGLTSFGVCVLLLVGGVVVFALGRTVPGWTSLLVAIGFLSGVQLLCLGLLGEYVGRIYSRLQARPLFFVAYDTDQFPPREPSSEAPANGAVPRPASSVFGS